MAETVFDLHDTVSVGHEPGPLDPRLPEKPIVLAGQPTRLALEIEETEDGVIVRDIVVAWRLAA